MDNTPMSNFWTESAANYSSGTMDELAGEQKQVWLELLNKNRTPGDHLKILDAGCGPGFFSILMAGEGHELTAIDLSDGMLEQARENARANGLENSICFAKMDAQRLEFPEASFDLVICRNITWMFDKSGTAFVNWLRILKPGGRILYFDGNWYMHYFDEELMKKYEENLARAKKLGFEYKDVHKASDEEIELMMKQLPLSCVHRPEWDRSVFESLPGCKIIKIDTELPRNVMREVGAVKNEHTPMFMVCVEKERND